MHPPPPQGGGFSGTCLQPAIVTILQGKATVIRGVSEYDVLNEGMRFPQMTSFQNEGTTPFLRGGIMRNQSWLELRSAGTEFAAATTHQPARQSGPGLYLLHGLRSSWKASPAPDTGQGHRRSRC